MNIRAIGVRLRADCERNPRASVGLPPDYAAATLKARGSGEIVWANSLKNLEVRAGIEPTYADLALGAVATVRC